MGGVAVITRSRTVRADARAIWNVLVDFGALSSWVDGVAHSEVLKLGPDGTLGTARRVQVGRDALVETVTDVVEPTTLAYTIEGMPARLRGLSNRWTLDPAGTGTVVTVTSTVRVAAGPASRPAEWAVGRVMAKMSDEMLEGLARRMESRHDG